MAIDWVGALWQQLRVKAMISDAVPWTVKWAALTVVALAPIPLLAMEPADASETAPHAIKAGAVIPMMPTETEGRTPGDHEMELNAAELNTDSPLQSFESLSALPVVPMTAQESSVYQIQRQQEAAGRLQNLMETLNSMAKEPGSVEAARVLVNANGDPSTLRLLLALEAIAASKASAAREKQRVERAKQKAEQEKQKAEQARVGAAQLDIAQIKQELEAAQQAVSTLEKEKQALATALAAEQKKKYEASSKAQKRKTLKNNQVHPLQIAMVVAGETAVQARVVLVSGQVVHQGQSFSAAGRRHRLQSIESMGKTVTGFERFAVTIATGKKTQRLVFPEGA